MVIYGNSKSETKESCKRPKSGFKEDPSTVRYEACRIDAVSQGALNAVCKVAVTLRDPGHKFMIGDSPRYRTGSDERIKDKLALEIAHLVTADRLDIGTKLYECRRCFVSRCNFGDASVAAHWAVRLNQSTDVSNRIPIVRKPGRQYLVRIECYGSIAPTRRIVNIFVDFSMVGLGNRADWK
jgi:hypothetical protein